jgi:hypothetical protein
VSVTKPTAPQPEFSFTFAVQNVSNGERRHNDLLAPVNFPVGSLRPKRGAELLSQSGTDGYFGPVKICMFTGTIKKNAETLIDASKEVGQEINVEKTKCMLLSRHQM